jgi:deoxyribose-phosphate aldolase
MVIARSVFLAGDYNRIFDEIAATKKVCGAAPLKVILETGALQIYDNIRLPSENRDARRRRLYQGFDR